MVTCTYKLPQHWASYFINGDRDGYVRSELRAMFAIERELLMTGYNACALSCSDNVDFMKYHDAIHVYPYAADCVEFTFAEK
jgi:hypothetical protein